MRLGTSYVVLAVQLRYGPGEASWCDLAFADQRASFYLD